MRIVETANLKPTTLVRDIEEACTRARDEKRDCVCVPPLFIKTASGLLNGSKVKVAAVIGYPYGYSPTEVKLAEVMLSILDGADELYITANILAIKNNDWSYIAKEVNQITAVTRSRDKVVKMLVDTSTLTDEEVAKCAKLLAPAEIEVVGFTIS